MPPTASHDAVGGRRYHSLMQRPMNLRGRWAVPVICLALLPLAAPADIYRWKDETGQVHYGQRPPPAGADKLELEQRPATRAVPDSQAARRARQQRLLEAFAYEREQKRAAAERAARDNRRSAADCRRLQRRWRLLSHPGPVYLANDDGGRDYLSDERRAAAKTDIRPAYLRACGEEPPA